MTRAARVYDFTIPASGAITILAEGSFYRLMTAAGALEVRRNNGSIVGPLLPGQGERADFLSLTLSDKSGATNAGSILIGDDTFIDDRITGEVSVINGGMARTKAGNAYLACAVLTSSAGNYSHIGIFNPTASGINAFVSAVHYNGYTSGNYEIRVLTAALANSFTVNNKIVGGAAGVVAGCHEQAASMLGGTIIFKTYASTATPNVYRQDEPLLLRPGYGICVLPVVVNANMACNFEYIEVPE